MISGIGSSSMSMSAMMRGVDPSKMQEKMFAKVDGNGDGGIDKTELGQFTAKLESMGMRAPEGKGVDEAFGKFDADGSGAISKDELKAGMESLQKSGAMPFGPFGGQSMSTSMFSSLQGGGGSDITSLIDQLRGSSGSGSSAKSNGDDDLMQTLMQTLTKKYAEMGGSGVSADTTSSLLRTTA